MKTFLVINTSYFGDTLLTGPLCRNLKRKYPDAQLIFMVNKPFFEAAKYMDGVDQVICYDKKGKHKGIAGFWRFYQEHKKEFLGRIDAAFVIYGNERGIVLSKLFRAKKIYSDNQGLLRFFLANGKIEYEAKLHTQDKHMVLFEAYAHEPAISLPMQYTPPKGAKIMVDQLLAGYGVGEYDELIALCATSKRQEKDMDVGECIKLIHILRRRGKKVLFVGAGSMAVAYADTLREKKCHAFIDLTDKTTIAQLAEVIKRCQAAVSVDTGTMHLICALNVPLVAVFYLHDEAHLASWAPKVFYPHRLMVGDDFSAEAMADNIEKLKLERH